MRTTFAREAYPDADEPSLADMESISSFRQPQSNEAVYLLMPTSKNVQLLIDDFNRPTPVYAAAHLFFMDGTLIIRSLVLYYEMTSASPQLSTNRSSTILLIHRLGPS